MRMLVLDGDAVVNVIEAEQGFDPGPGLTTIEPPDDSVGTGWTRDGDDWIAPPAPPPPPPDAFAVDAERDRRVTRTFTFGGKAFQLDARSQERITAMGADARFAILAGAQPDDLRWADPDADFGWIATDNSILPMDAQTMAAFADAAKLWVARHTFAARALKDANPIPVDFTNDGYWPE